MTISREFHKQFRTNRTGESSKKQPRKIKKPKAQIEIECGGEVDNDQGFGREESSLQNKGKQKDNKTVNGLGVSKKDIPSPQGR